MDPVHSPTLQSTIVLPYSTPPPALMELGSTHYAGLLRGEHRLLRGQRHRQVDRGGVMARAAGDLPAGRSVGVDVLCICVCGIECFPFGYSTLDCIRRKVRFV